MKRRTAQTACLLASLWALAVVCHAQTTEAQLDKWIAQLNDLAPTYRVQAAARLGRMGPGAAAAVEPLVRALTDENADVRLQAVVALVRIGERPTEVAQHIIPLIGDENEHVDYAAQWAMRHLYRKAFAVPPDDATVARWQRLLDQALQRMADARAHAQLIADLNAALAACEQLVLQRQREAERRRLAEERRRQRAKALNDLQLLVDQAVGGTPLDRARAIVTLAPDRLHHASWDDRLLPQEVLTARLQVLQAIGPEQTHVWKPLLTTHWKETFSDGVWELIRRATATSAVDPTVLNWLADAPVEQPDHVRLLESIVLNPGRSIELRHSAISALGNGHTCAGEVIPVLLQCLQDESLREARGLVLAALESVASGGDLPQLDPHLSDAAEQVLVHIIADKELDRFQRVKALRCASLLLPGSRICMEQFLESDLWVDCPDYELAEMLHAIARFEHVAMADVLILRAIASADDLARHAAIKVVRRLGAAVAAKLLLDRLADPAETPANRDAAAEQLAMLGSDAIARAAFATREQNEVQARWMLNALSRWCSDCPEALPAFVQWAEDPQAGDQVRCAALMCVASLGTQADGAAPSLYQLLKQTDSPPVRAATLLALHATGRLTGSLLQAAREAKNPEERFAALYIDARDGSEAAYQRIIAELDGPDQQFARAVLMDLNDLAVHRLLRVAHDQDAPVGIRVAAAETSARLDGCDVTILLDLLGDPEVGEACLWVVHDMLLERNRDVLVTMGERAVEADDAVVVQRLNSLLEAAVDGLGAGGDDSGLFVSNLAGLLIGTDRSQSTTMLAESAPLETFTEGGSSFENAATREAPGAEHSDAAVPSLASRDHPGDWQAMAVSPPGLPPMASAAQMHNGEQNENVGASATETMPLSEPMLSTNRQPGVAPPGLSEALPVQTTPSNRPATERESGASDTSSPQCVRVFYATNRAVREVEAAPPRSSDQSPVGWLIAASVFALGLLWTRSRGIGAVGLAVTLAGFIVQIRATDSTDLLAVDRRSESPAYEPVATNTLRWGHCEVTIPVTHQTGNVERPRVWRFEFAEDSRKHVVIQSVRELDATRFFDELNQESRQGGGGVLVFVHGYNVSFEQAIMRTAQMAYDLKYPGASVAFSWPSHGNWYKYKLDRKNIELSVPLIRSCLEQIAAKTNARSIDVIAHSMGNVGLTQALAEMHTEQPARINNVVLAAPDIDADVFAKRIVPRLQGKARRLTLYASSNDLALRASRYFNTGPRAGESLYPPPDYPGIEVIDATGYDPSLLGHSYYGSSAGIIRDLSMLLRGKPAPERPDVRVAYLGDRQFHYLSTGSEEEAAEPTSQSPAGTTSYTAESAASN